jgi:hypothetical protein
MVNRRNFCDCGFTESQEILREIQEIQRFRYFIGGVFAALRHSAAEDKAGSG